MSVANGTVQNQLLNAAAWRKTPALTAQGLMFDVRQIGLEPVANTVKMMNVVGKSLGYAVRGPQSVSAVTTLV